MKRRTIRMDADSLTEEALRAANPEQKATLEACLKNGWKVMKVLTIYEPTTKSAINVAAKDLSGWITPDGKLHRPLKGKRHVAVNTRTLERVW